MKYSIIKIPFDACIVEKARRGASKGPDAVEAELKNILSFKAKSNTSLRTLRGYQSELSAIQMPCAIAQLSSSDRRSQKSSSIEHSNPKNIEFSEIKEKDDFDKMHKDAKELASKKYKEKNFVIGLGGDHSVSYGLMKAFAKNHKKASLIYFDAHLDCEDDFLPPTHEDVIRAAVNEKFFSPQNILMVGARNLFPKEVKFVEEKGIKLGKLEDVHNFIKNRDNLYISIDIDVFDPEFAPGTGYPEKNGYKPNELLPAIKELIKTGKVKGADIVEVSPPKDVNNITSKLAAKLLLEFLE